MLKPWGTLRQKLPRLRQKAFGKYRPDMLMFGCGLVMLALSCILLLARPAAQGGASLGGWFRINDKPFMSDEVPGRCFVNLSSVARVEFYGRGPSESVMLYTEDGERCDNEDLFHGWRSADVKGLRAALQRRSDRWIAVSGNLGADTYLDLTKVFQVRFQKPSSSSPPSDRSVREVAFLYARWPGWNQYPRLGVVDRKDTLAQLRRMMRGGLTEP